MIELRVRRWYINRTIQIAINPCNSPVSGFIYPRWYVETRPRPDFAEIEVDRYCRDTTPKSFSVMSLR